MNRLVLATIAVFLAGGVAAYDLLSQRLLAAGRVAIVVTLGLVAVAAVLLLVAIATAFQDVNRSKAQPVADRARIAARGITWSSVFAVGFSVLLFANCGSAIDSGPNLALGAMSDARLFWSLAAAFQTPLLVSLALPGILASIAETTRRPAVATAVIVTSIFGPVLAVLTIPFAFIFGVSNCDVGTVGGCAAGVGAMTNLFVASTLALFVPYAVVLARAINAERGPS